MKIKLFMMCMITRVCFSLLQVLEMSNGIRAIWEGTTLITQLTPKSIQAKYIGTINHGTVNGEVLCN